MMQRWRCDGSGQTEGGEVEGGGVRCRCHALEPAGSLASLTAAEASR
jgi:hypothetical protein